MTPEEFEKAVGSPLHTWAKQCHAASLKLVKSGVLGECRVARGACRGVGSQHSWVVLGRDCYNPNAAVVDPTLWSYDDTVEGVWVGKAKERPYTPHGSGSIWAWGRPDAATDEPLTLDGEFSKSARMFLDMVGPLDRKGWAQLAHAPVGGWPSAEIFLAMYRDKRLSALVPIDVIGMLTDENPGGLYLAGGGDEDGDD